MAHGAAIVRSGLEHLSPDEILRSEVDVLVGVGERSARTLQELGIRSVFDLGASQWFAVARSIEEAGRLDATPGDWVVGDPPLPGDLPSLPLERVRALTAVAAALTEGIGARTVHELAGWGPYVAARGLVDQAFGLGSSDPTDRLVPRAGELPTERTYFETLVLLDAPMGTHDRGDLEKAGPLDLTEALRAPSVARLAVGAQLTFAQTWFSEGVTLGQLLHCLALAPGEATRVAVVDWSRRTSALSSESIEENEDLSSVQVHARSINEVQRAVAREAQQGFSSVATEASTESSAEQSASGTGLIESLFESSDRSSAAQSATQSGQTTSRGWTTGERDIAASLQQKVMDRTEQQSSLVRGRRASAVREIAQQEHEQISTRIVANYNRQHALTVQYYEVVQLYRVSTALHRAERILFVPVAPLDFADAAVVDRHRPALVRAALSPRVAELLVDPTSVCRISPASARVLLRHRGPRIADRLVVGAATARPDDAPPPTPTRREERFAGGAVGQALERGAVFTWNEDAIAVASRVLDRSLLRRGSHDLHVPDDCVLQAVAWRDFDASRIVIDRVDGKAIALTPSADGFAEPPEDVDLAAVRSVSVAKAGAGAASGTVALHLARDGRRFEVPVPVRLGAGTDLVVVARVTSDRQARAGELAAHLQAHAAWYSQAAFRALDVGTLTRLLAAWRWNGRPLLQQVDPSPLAVTAEHLVFRAPASDRAWADLVAERGLSTTRVETRRVPIPTGGVFAEAVLGRSNAAEKIDLTRFTQWHEAPIPLAPPEISPLVAGSRAQDEAVAPSQLGSANLGIEAPSALPDPAGLGAVLQTLANGAMFRDMAGLAGTQATAQAAQAAATQAAGDAGALASQNLATEAAKSVAMAQTAADLAKAALGAKGGLPGVAGRSLTGLGGAVNLARDADARTPPSAPSEAGASPSTSAAPATPSANRSRLGGASSVGGQEQRALDQVLGAPSEAKSLAKVAAEVLDGAARAIGVVAGPLGTPGPASLKLVVDLGTRRFSAMERFDRDTVVLLAEEDGALVRVAVPPLGPSSRPAASLSAVEVTSGPKWSGFEAASSLQPFTSLRHVPSSGGWLVTAARGIPEGNGSLFYLIPDDNTGELRDGFSLEPSAGRALSPPQVPSGRELSGPRATQVLGTPQHVPFTEGTDDRTAVLLPAEMRIAVAAAAGGQVTEVKVDWTPNAKNTVPRFSVRTSHDLGSGAAPCAIHVKTAANGDDYLFVADGASGSVFVGLDPGPDAVGSLDVLGYGGGESSLPFQSPVAFHLGETMRFVAEKGGGIWHLGLVAKFASASDHTPTLSGPGPVKGPSGRMLPADNPKLHARVADVEVIALSSIPASVPAQGRLLVLGFDPATGRYGLYASFVIPI